MNLHIRVFKREVAKSCKLVRFNTESRNLFATNKAPHRSVDNELDSAATLLWPNRTKAEVDPYLPQPKLQQASKPNSAVTTEYDKQCSQIASYKAIMEIDNKKAIQNKRSPKELLSVLAQLWLIIGRHQSRTFVQSKNLQLVPKNS